MNHCTCYSGFEPSISLSLGPSVVWHRHTLHSVLRLHVLPQVSFVMTSRVSAVSSTLWVAAETHVIGELLHVL